MDYSAAVALYLDEAFDATKVTSLAAFYAKYAAHTDCKCNVAIPEAEATDTSKLTAAESITFAIEENAGMMGLVIKAAEGLNVKVYYVDALGAKHDMTVEYAGGNYVVSGISAAYIDNVMYISIGEAEGTYSLATYVANNQDVALAKALLEYAIAAENYKNQTQAEIDAEK